MVGQGQGRAGGSADENGDGPANLTCCAFSPGSGSLFAVGGLGASFLTILESGERRGSPSSSSSSSLSPSRRLGRVKWASGGGGSGGGGGGGDCLALAWSPCARFLATVDRQHTVSVWRVPTKWSKLRTPNADADADAERKELEEEEKEAFRLHDDQPAIEETLTLHVQYLNQPLSSNFSSLLPPSPASSVFVCFPSSRHLLFYHAQENCVKVWTAGWLTAEEEESKSASASTAASSPSSLRTSLQSGAPVVFQSDRLTSSTQSSLIQFLEDK